MCNRAKVYEILLMKARYWNGWSEQKKIRLVTRPSRFSWFLRQGKPISGGTHEWAWMASVNAFLCQQRCPIRPRAQVNMSKITSLTHAQFISALRWLKNILALISRWRHRSLIAFKATHFTGPSLGVTLASGWWRRSINPESLLSDPTFTFTFILHWNHSVSLYKRRIWPLNIPRAGSQLKLMLWPKSDITVTVHTSDQKTEIIDFIMFLKE